MTNKIEAWRDSNVYSGLPNRVSDYTFESASASLSLERLRDRIDDVRHQSAAGVTASPNRYEVFSGFFDVASGPERKFEEHTVSLDEQLASIRPFCIFFIALAHDVEQCSSNLRELLFVHVLVEDTSVVYQSLQVRVVLEEPLDVLDPLRKCKVFCFGGHRPTLSTNDFAFGIEYTNTLSYLPNKVNRFYANV